MNCLTGRRNLLKQKAGLYLLFRGLHELYVITICQRLDIFIVQIQPIYIDCIQAVIIMNIKSDKETYLQVA